MRIVFLDRDTFGGSVDITPPAGPHEWREYERTSPEQLVERLEGADVAITNKVPIREAALAQLPDLKMISVAATGYDVIDIDACRRQGVVVSNVRGYARHTVPEHTFALLLNLRRSVAAYHDDVAAGEWQRAGQFCFFNHPIRDLAGSRLGIIGAGVIGQAVAGIGRAFGMETVFAARPNDDRPAEDRLPWDEVLQTSDVITLHIPLTPETRHCIGADAFARMQRRPLIINTARGGLVDETALVDALDARRIAGFGFDVLSTEPPASDNPLMRVLDRPNVLVTPHVAWASEQAMAEVWRQTIAHVDAFAQGRPENVLT